MNIIICHAYAHRLLNSNLIESAPVCESKQEGGWLMIADLSWQQRTAESMDLTGGDMELIRSHLEWYGHAFPDDRQRLPHVTPETPSAPGAMDVRG